MKQEYGGYIELDTYQGKEYHENALALNCGRSCLKLLLEKEKIKKIYLPYFCCDSVAQPCRKSGTEIEYYHIKQDFRPIFEKELKENEWVYIVNYYGQLTQSEICSYKNQYQNIVIDNAQAFFESPAEKIDTLYTCRKFFGVADGAYLYTDISNVEDDFEKDYSFERMRFLLGRYEKEANEFYQDYVENNHLFREEPVKTMSKLTHNLLRGIDYEKVSQTRKMNFAYLHQKLNSFNRLDLNVPEGAFMYPFYIEGGENLRKQLQKKRIYIPTLWADVFDVCEETDLEYDMAKNILPIPVDQRYTTEDMEYLATEVLKCIG